MDSKTQIIEQYFKLSELVSNDKQALHEIIQLFSKRTVVEYARLILMKIGNTSKQKNENYFQNQLLQ
ncbi:hypothetical protein S101189_02028 (plasmid) [Pediococcus acidilactici]|nr:hypothetical protein S100424_02032 [Pediococcus acidilactici]ARW27510.1 hypothetical protein S100313_02109 [Pediococcus acidilactici]ARW29548.1 hypothetical protein S101189_02028 [Pediococcus acidilactici]OBR30380.1 hypothetical protein SRCM100320_00652 [Pediococcus acidilactici]QAR71994.1 hypothetical protein EQJ92_09590 [Pediococcus acidilactici]